jgi:hypothetical protein
LEAHALVAGQAQSHGLCPAPRQVPKFADMNENPPEAVLAIREQMGRQAARKFRAPF